ncbi:MAG: dienelactone hydrolase family protein [Gammaproteobacteria bacterium]|nr:dienelactone hydrolase family protein [Gammaproteobacteria bacterium]
MFALPDIRRILLAALISVFVLIGGCSSDQSDGARSDAADTDAFGRKSKPSPAANDSQAGAERPVDAETLPYAEVDEELVYGHFAFPSDMVEPLPAIIVVHDWWGLNDEVRDAASRLAGAGYMVLAVDLYGGETVSSVEAARAKMISVMENPDDVEANLQQALGFVSIAGAPKKAALGWGFGGSWSLNSTMMFPNDVDAAVIFYGQVSNDEDRLRAINAPVLGFFGDRDRGIKIESVQEFEDAMQRLRKDLTLKVYQDVGHAFTDPARTNYHSGAAEDSWRRTIEFFAANLSATDES